MRYKAFLTVSLLAGVCQVLAANITYQGRLLDGGFPANGIYDFQFSLHDAEQDGNVVAPGLTNSAVIVSNGLFTVPLDFGSDAFNGTARWLELGVRTNGAIIPYALLAPRQSVAAAPHAIHAENAASAVTASNVTGSVSDAQLSGNMARLNTSQAFTGTVTFNPPDGPPFHVTGTSVVTNLNADLLDGINATGFWKLGGNTAVGTNFIGTINSEQLELRVGNNPVLRFYPSGTSPQFTAGHGSNRVTLPGAYGTVIGGGGNASSPNVVSDDYAVINGGTANLAGNTNNSFDITHPTVGGGFNNRATNSFAIVAGGRDNIAGGIASTVPGGEDNVATGAHSFAAGRRAQARHTGSFVWADSINADFGSSTSNQFLIRAGQGVGVNTTNTDAVLNLSSSDWRKITMSSPEQTARFRFGGDGAAGNVTANAWWTGGTWLRDDTNAPSFAYLQHAANGRHEFRVAQSAPGSVSWTTAMVVHTNGNVGVGVGTPSARLEVGGQVKITGGSPGQGKILVSDANGLATWQSPSALSIFFGQNYSELLPNIIDNTVDVEIEGVMIDKVVVVNGPGLDIQRIPGFNGTNAFDQPGPNMEYPFIFEYNGAYTNALQAWSQAYTNDPAASRRVMSVIVRYLNGIEGARWNLFEMNLTQISAGSDGRKRYTLRHALPPNNRFGYEREMPVLMNSSKNPATDFYRIEIEGVDIGPYPATEVNYTNRTITLTFDQNEAGEVYSWVKSVAEGVANLRAMSVITENSNGMEISRRNYFEVFPISFQQIGGFGQMEKLKERVVLSFATWEDA